MAARRITRLAQCWDTCCTFGQTVVGQKALQQIEMAGEYPDFINGEVLVLALPSRVVGVAGD